MIQIIMNAPGVMHEDKHNRYLTDEELGAILLAIGYVIVTPLPSYVLMVAPHKLMVVPVTEVGGFHIQESSDAATIAAAVGLTPKLPTEISGVGNLAFSNQRTLSILQRS